MIINVLPGHFCSAKVTWYMQALTDKGLDSLSALHQLSALSLARADGLNGSGLVVLQQLPGLKVGTNSA